LFSYSLPPTAAHSVSSTLPLHDALPIFVVSTTEHTHAFATLPALTRKKNVYCEKPLTRDVFEARIITEAAKAAGVATQMGTQIRSEEHTSELQSRRDLVCRLVLEKKNIK